MSSSRVVHASSSKRNPGFLVDAHYFHMTNHNFISGPSLPEKLLGPSIIGSGSESLILIGGLYPGGNYTQGEYPRWESSIYELQCANEKCGWTKLKQELQLGRRNFVAVPIQDARVSCRPMEND